MSADLFLSRGISAVIDRRYSEILGVCFAPNRVLFQRALGAVPVPRITPASFLRNLLKVIVNGFVPISKNRTIGADLVITSPDRSAAGGGCEAASTIVGALKGHV